MPRSSSGILREGAAAEIARRSAEVFSPEDLPGDILSHLENDGAVKFEVSVVMRRDENGLRSFATGCATPLSLVDTVYLSFQTDTDNGPFFNEWKEWEGLYCRCEDVCTCGDGR